MIRMIITGNIGSGKSLFTQRLKEKLNMPEVRFIDIDVKLQEMYDDPEFRVMLEKDLGTFDRKEIAQLVLVPGNTVSDKLTRIGTKFIDIFMQNMLTSNQHFIIEIPYYFEMLIKYPESIVALTREQVYVISVLGPDDEQRFERIKERCLIKHPHWTDEMIKHVMNTQCDTYLMAGLADTAIYNDSTLEYLESQINEVLRLMPYANQSLPTEVAYDLVGTVTFGGAMNNTICRNVFRLVENAYFEPNRSYHNIHHINSMIKMLERSNYSQKNHIALKLAIMFHDFIYTAGRDDNEEMSFTAMLMILKIFQPDLYKQDNVIELVQLMILSTWNHEVFLPASPATDELKTQFDFDIEEMIKVFLDLDLGIFTRPYDEVMIYETQIRREYTHVQDSEYYPRRIKVLSDFLERKNIYKSKEFQGTFLDSHARANIGCLINYCKEELEKHNV